MKKSPFSSNLLSEDTPFEHIQQIESRGTTSLTYRVSIKGKNYFLKQLRPEYKNDWRYRAAFHKEFEIGRSIDCKHVVKYISVNENENGVYLLTEHVNGLTINQKLSKDPEFFGKADHFEKIFLQLLMGIEAFHKTHVAYLDLNPDNVMLTQVNNDVIIVDLGFCFANSYSHTSGCTHDFAAPELRRGELKEIDASTDIYALGRLMLYIKDISCATISPQLQRIINKCVSEKKQDRYNSVNEVIQDIQRKRKWIVTTLITTLILTLLGGGFWHLYNNNRIDDFKQSLRWFFTTPEYDFSHDLGNYRILSEDSLTCINVGGPRRVNLYILDEVPHNGKTYQVVGIGDEAYAGRDINSVYIPNGIKEIGRSTFTQCDNIVSIHIPRSVERIGRSSFCKLTNLRSLVISPNIKVIPDNAFSSCEKLKKVTIPEGVEEIGLDAFGKCYELQKITLPSTLKAIRRGVFWECTNLKEIEIPASVTTIGEYTFYYCDSLKHVYNYATTPQVIPVIFNRSDITLHVPQESVELYRKADNWNKVKIVGFETKK